MTWIDSLTGLYNRRHLEECLAELAAGCRRHGHDLSALVIDIDHFKQVNDTYGHPAGDAVLIELARRIRMCLRTEDVPGRWGGEEFLVLLPFIDAAGAEVVAERLRATVAGSPFNLGSGEVVAVTVSVGGAVARDGHDLVHRADAALYEAKRAGRDAVRLAPAAGVAVVVNGT